MMAVEKSETVNRKKTCWSDSAATDRSSQPLHLTLKFQLLDTIHSCVI